MQLNSKPLRKNTKSRITYQCNGFEITSASEKHMVEDNILFTNPRQNV